ncbi:helix-turn-helix domain-containing protein [Pseudomonas oryzihabitans]|uniref:helix-turn-helix domain-containing protein n=1 Tax=Pseudomonas oryzihabitans TaxID=47885 RepID=UPI0028604E32|nr:helix-turn-helix transcriptional regulator [Pseudomonas psychrotolerans]MDR6675977.1 transcriptional regulator with XRE-family HTH domain [Pseudomonas psychrotolerans]
MLESELALRLKALRLEQGWSLEQLATRSGVSRATLSRLENAEVSPTTMVLGQLCAAYGLTLTRLLHSVESGFPAHLGRDSQQVWRDPDQAFSRRSVSPPSRALAGEVIESELGPGVDIRYEHSPRPGLEHHLVLLEGELELWVEDQPYRLVAGDCLRYRLWGSSRFLSGSAGARYLLFLI